MPHQTVAESFYITGTRFRLLQKRLKFGQHWRCGTPFALNEGIITYFPAPVAEK